MTNIMDVKIVPLESSCSVDSNSVVILTSGEDLKRLECTVDPKQPLQLEYSTAQLRALESRDKGPPG